MRGNPSRTGIDPKEVGIDEFFYTNFNTKIKNDGSTCIKVTDAKYYDGEYYLYIDAINIKNKSSNPLKQKVILGNWTPQIKSITTNTSVDKILKSGDTLEIKFEFTEQMNTEKTPTVQIWDASGSKWVTLSLNSSSWQNSKDGLIKDAILSTTAKLPELGNSNQNSVKDLKIKVTNAYGVGGKDDVIKTEHSEKDVEGKELKIIADLYKPKTEGEYLIPQTVIENEPQQVGVGAKYTDNESGMDKDGKITVTVGDKTYEGKISDSGDGGYIIDTNVTSPLEPGDYPVTMEIPDDEAGNKPETSKKTIGILTVKEEPKDNPSNPDESFDRFDSTLTGNKAPRIGQPKVAIFRAGYALEMADLLATFGEAADFVNPENFAPGLVSKYPILVVPSAALASQANLDSLREKFSEYVAAGGNLIIMAQPTSKCYELLPDKVESVGYFQDKACYIATAGIRKYNYAMAGQTDTTVDGTADGVITSWPEGAETWLYRLKNNFPALLAYSHGKGKVIVSNYYSDYAHGHSQLNKDEKALLRDLLSWGRDFASSIPEMKPGESLPVEVLVKYTNMGQVSGKAASAKLILRSPDRKQVLVKDYPVELSSGESTKLQLVMDDTDQKLSNGSGLGIWWVNYELYDSAGQLLQSENEGQRVVVSKHLEKMGVSNLAITVNSPLTTVLEGTKIPFKVVARNDSGNSRQVHFKVYAVLYTLVSRVQDETEVYSGTINIGPHSSQEVITELMPFKAYTSVVSQSWDKNWWRFVFTDENGEEIIQEFRGVSGYRPAAEIKYNLRNLTNPEAVVFKAGDRIALDLQIASLVPVGYPVDWSIDICQKNQPDQPFFTESGTNVMLDPVLMPYQIFTIPEDCYPDSLIVTAKVKYNGKEIPLVQNGKGVSFNEVYSLKVQNFGMSNDGIIVNVYNPTANYTDFTIRSKIYDEQNNLVKEDYQSLGINGLSNQLVSIPIEDFKPFIKYRIEGFYLTYPTTHAGSFNYQFKSAQGIVNAKIISSRLIENNKIQYNLEITNNGLPVKGARLKVTGKNVSLGEFDLPEIREDEIVQIPVQINQLEKLEPASYPIKFTVVCDGGSEFLVCEDSPKLVFGNLEVHQDEIQLVLNNKGVLNSDYRLVTKIYRDDLVLNNESDLTGLILGNESKSIIIPIEKNNPFQGLMVVCSLSSPAAGTLETTKYNVAPCLLEVKPSKEQLTAVNNKVNCKFEITNLGREITNLKSKVEIIGIDSVKVIDLPRLAKGETFQFENELPVRQDAKPGTYQLQVTLFDNNGGEKKYSAGSIVILPPKLTVSAQYKQQCVPGESYGLDIQNIGVAPTDFSYDIQLIDLYNKEIAHYTGSGKLNVDETANPRWVLGDNLASGSYYLIWKVKTAPIVREFSGSKKITIQGITSDLSITTDQPIYQITQPVIGQAQLVNGNYPVDGDLELTINHIAFNPGERIDQYPCPGANLQRTGLVKLSGKITKPTAMWSNDKLYSFYPFARKLIGDINGDERNEIIDFTYSILVIDGLSGIERELVGITQKPFYPVKEMLELIKN